MFKYLFRFCAVSKKKLNITNYNKYKNKSDDSYTNKNPNLKLESDLQEMEFLINSLKTLIGENNNIMNLPDNQVDFLSDIYNNQSFSNNHNSGYLNNSNYLNLRNKSYENQVYLIFFIILKIFFCKSRVNDDNCMDEPESLRNYSTNYDEKCSVIKEKLNKIKKFKIKEKEK